ncbi:Omp28-related outer membrane protein [Porphyromonas sp.]|uniref:Omp28-related outer membrane protein n=1 Tax=Porphyromonas sp. TaxID=1924944 RepID=UPI0026DB7E3D|nr:Omp28-related outer membrane protein [Porphyromonas sp.]MDO4770845.1 Omp28-related outer membrane protein [Porphyromonas sp.]
MNTRVLFTFLTLAMFVLVGACKSDSGKSTPVEPSLTLTASKKVIIADGKDNATFTVIDQDGKDVTASCIFTAGGKELLDNSMVSTVAGDFEVFAKNTAGTKSNVIKVKALSEKANFEVRASRAAIVADGGDLVTLSLWDRDNDLEVTEGATFYLDGKAIDGNILRLRQKGTRKVTGVWNGKEAKKSLTVSGVDLRTITGRSLIETLTATTCRYCKSEIETIEKVDGKSDRAIVIAIHNEFSSVHDNILDEDARRDAMSFITYVAKGERATPNSFVNRGEKKIKIGNIGAEVFLSQWIPNNSDVAISIDTKIDGDKIKVLAHVTGKIDLNGKIVAALVENGRTAAQDNMGVIEMKQILRGYRPSVLGQDFSVEKGKAKVFNTEFNIGSAKPENCNVIVFVKEPEGQVKNVQQVKAGQAIGY